MTGDTRVDAAGTQSSGRGRAGRFALVGVANTTIDFVGFGLLAAVGAPLLLANFLSTSAGWRSASSPTARSRSGPSFRGGRRHCRSS